LKLNSLLFIVVSSSNPVIANMMVTKGLHDR